MKNEANTIHQSTGSGGNTSQYVLEPILTADTSTLAEDKDNSTPPPRIKRCNSIQYKFMENGNIRAYKTSDPHHGNASELQITHPNNESQTVTTAHVPKTLEQTNIRYRIRKLTPREVLRLMDVEDKDIDKLINAEKETILKSGVKKVNKVLSKSTLYKMAGNSIVCSCLYHIFRTLFIPNQPEHAQIKPIQKSLFD